VLKVRYGAFRALEPAFLAELAELQKSDPLAPVAVVAPSRAMADRLQRLVAQDRARLNVRFHTFFSLAQEIDAETGREPSEAAAPCAKPRLCTDPLLFDRLLDSLLGAEGSSRRPRRLAAAYRSTIKDLSDSGVAPSARELLPEGLIDDAEQSCSLAFLLGLLERQEAELSRLGVESSSALARRAAALAADSHALKRYRALLYYGFYDLTGVQADLFEAVSREHPVRLFYPYLKGHPAYSFADRFFQTRLHGAGASPREACAGAPGALGAALDCLFAPGKSAKIAEGTLRISSASGAREEVWRAAKEILRLVEEEGYAFSEIGVAARTLEPYRSALDEVFGSCAVPFHFSAEEPLLRRPCARAVWTLLNLGRRDFPALSVLELTGSVFFSGRREQSWPALVERLRIHRGWLQWEGRLAQWTRKDFDLRPGAPEPLLVPKEETAALWELLVSWRKALRPEGRRSWAQWAEYAQSFVRANLRVEEDDGFEQALEEISSLSVLDRLGRDADFSEFLEALEERLFRATAPLCSQANAGVRALDVMEARGESFRALFLLGLQQGLFPRTVREDPLLRDRSRRALRDAGGYWISAKADGHEEEKLLFHMAVSSAHERLYASFQRSDEEGRALVPSLYLSELCRACGVRLSELCEHVPRQPQDRLCTRGLEPYLTPREASLACVLSGLDPWPLHKALGMDADRCRELRGRARELNRLGAPGPLDGVVGPPQDLLKRLLRGGISPSALECLAGCPFQFFASRVLGFEEPQEPSQAGDIDPRFKGELYHAFLAEFYRRVREGADFAQAFARAEEQSFGPLDWRSLGLYPLVWEVARERMIAALDLFLRWDMEQLRSSGMRPVLMEEELEGPVFGEVPEALKGLRWKGRLDRVDADEGRFRVVDYKTRWDRGLAKLVQAGERFQPPVYLELASQCEALKGLESAGVSFLSIESFLEGGTPEHPYSAEEHAQALPFVRGHLQRILERVVQGAFTIRPDDGEYGRCRFCPFGGLCRKSHPMTRARAAGVNA
jgi:ATP-dependent helicase/nuclease subunit B